MKRTVATPPGHPTQYIDLTPEELAQEQAKEQAWASRVKPFQDRLRQKFLEVLSAHAADLTDEQIAEVMTASATIESVFPLAVPDAVKKKMLTGTIKRVKGLPASKDAVKQEMIDFVEAEF